MTCEPVGVYHLELRQFPHNTCAFNLTGEDLRPVLEPWVRERVFEYGEQKWVPQKAKLTILEGPHLAVEQLAMGRGWGAAQRESEDVTERLLAAAQAAERGAVSAAAAPATPSPAAQAPAAQAPANGPASGTPSPGEAPAAGTPAYPRSLGALLGSDPARLLAAWQAVVARSPGLAPSESLLLAERQIGGSGAERN